MSEGSSFGDHVDQQSTPLTSSSSSSHAAAHPHPPNHHLHNHHNPATDDDTLPIEVADLLQIRGDYEEVGSNLTLMSSEDQLLRDEALETFELEDIKEPEEESLQVTELLQLKGDREEVGSNQSEVSEDAEKEREQDLQALLAEEAKEAEEKEIDTLPSSSHAHGAIGIPTKPKVAIYYHVECTKHYIPDHPEQPARVKVILNAIQQRFSDMLSYREASYAKDEHIELFHTKDLIATFNRKWEEANAIYQKSKEVVYKRIDGDTKIMWGTRNAAYRAVGSVIDAVDHLYADPTSDPLAVDTAFCCIRPPGHHAERNLSCGFCFFNNVAIGAKYAQHKYGVDRVAVLDFDVHHGNGTEEGFVPFENLFYASTHEKDNFPGTGIDPSPYVGDKARDPLHRRIVNRTLPGGPKSRGEFRIKWLQILKEMELFQPQLIIISAGKSLYNVYLTVNI